MPNEQSNLEKQFNQPPQFQEPAAKPKFNLKYILIVLGLATLVGGGILAYQYWWLPKQETKLPEIKVQDWFRPLNYNETAGWQTYQNEEYGFEIKIPSEWQDYRIIVNQETSDSGIYPEIHFYLPAADKNYQPPEGEKNWPKGYERICAIPLFTNKQVKELKEMYFSEHDIIARKDKYTAVGLGVYFGAIYSRYNYEDRTSKCQLLFSTFKFIE